MEQNVLWKPVEFTNGKYWVSEYGSVQSKFYHYKHKKRFIATELKSSLSRKKNGYLRVNLHWKEGGSSIIRKEFIHRLVAICFIEKVEGKNHVNHKDGNKLNNHYSNLEWCTPQENNDHGVLIGLLKRGKNPKPYLKKGRANTFKPIIDLNTGIFWTTDEVAFLLGTKRRYVYRILLEERQPNRTQFRYA